VLWEWVSRLRAANGRGTPCSASNPSPHNYTAHCIRPHHCDRETSCLYPTARVFTRAWWSPLVTGLPIRLRFLLETSRWDSSIAENPPQLIGSESPTSFRSAQTRQERALAAQDTSRQPCAPPQDGRSHLPSLCNGDDPSCSLMVSERASESHACLKKFMAM
jgi:hypothetical protein